MAPTPPHQGRSTWCAPEKYSASNPVRMTDRPTCIVPSLRIQSSRSSAFPYVTLWGISTIVDLLFHPLHVPNEGAPFPHDRAAQIRHAGVRTGRCRPKAPTYVIGDVRTPG